MTAVCAALAFLFAFAAFAPPVEMRIDYTPAAGSTR